MLMHCAKAGKYCSPIALLFFMHVLFLSGVAQTQPRIEKAIAEKNIPLADSLLQYDIKFYYTQKNIDSLNNYVFYVGKVAQLQKSTEQALKAIQNYIEKIRGLSPQMVQLRQVYLEAGEFYSSIGKNTHAYNAYREAQKYTLRMPHNTPGQLGVIETNLGTSAHRMGDINLSQVHYRKALRNIHADSQPSYKNLYLAYNGMGSIMWFASKLDSALYFFNGALEALKKSDSSAINRFYRPAIIHNNLAGIYGVQGKTTDAIAAMKQCIGFLKEFIASREPDLKKNSAITFQFEATDNLGGIYKELGDYKQAQEILTYSYQQKVKHLDADDPAIFISQILLGQLYYAMKDYDKSVQFLTNGLERISQSDGDYLFWQADACNTLALLHDARNEALKAEKFFEQSDKLYEKSLQGNYDNIYLEFLSNAALFYAEQKMAAKALLTANKGYEYVNRTEGSQSLLAFYQLLNLAEVQFALGNYREALSSSKKGLEVVNAIIRSGKNLLDSIKMEIKKPRAILLKTKSEYELLTSKNPGNLNSILNELNEALNVLEKRKAVIRDAKDISLLMADHSELLEFVKKITFDLFKATGLERYSDRLVSLHESGVYNRIRLRLEKNAASQFAYLPPGLADKERSLKQAMEKSLASEGTHNEVMSAYVQAVDQWNHYLEQLRQDHPHYYKMRYASIFRPIQQVQPSLPDQVTFVRYFFVDKVLLALVMDRQEKHIVEIETTSLEKNITLLTQAGTNERITADILYNLYLQLWAPISKYVYHKKVVIIPDGILYNLSFDVLTARKISGFKELATEGLLSKHSLSYRYSLFLLEDKSSLQDLNKNFVAFAPGFSDKMKMDYGKSLIDTSDQDKVYLSLLPQPFTISLANKMQEQLKGNSFIYDRSTLTAFRQYAGMHKIIHVGTHAESNNLYPEFSRVIFAKDALKRDENNSLYLFDIYNCDLSSKLMVLTACETGRPGYQDGEGMISLAHAFNYAGSESILTGLWKIDEQASATLMDFFYENLLDGMDKDEALRQAKLKYLSKFTDRRLAPPYWAGLILMGNTSPVEIEKAGSSIWLILALALLLMAGAYLFFKFRKNP